MSLWLGFAEDAGSEVSHHIYERRITPLAFYLPHNESGHRKPSREMCYRPRVRRSNMVK